MERFSFKSGRAVRVVKLTKQDWPIVLHYNAYKEAAREAYESNPEKKKEAARKIYYVNSYSYISYAGVTVQQWT